MGVERVDEVTPLFIDMHICAEILHCSHEEFLRLSRIERSKLRNYLLVKNLKRQKELKDMEDESRAEEDKEQLLDAAPKMR